MIVDTLDPTGEDAAPPRPDWDEGARLRALDRYAILDTPRERGFDDIAEMAAEVCGTPIGIVSFIAADRQWFKAEVGVGVRSTPLETSFCYHAIRQRGLLVVPDARDDPRFRDNPLVVAEDGIRFYAAALLVTPEGLPLGTVAVADLRPRGLSPVQARTLERLARQVMAQLELRRALAERREEEERLRLAQEAGGIGTFEIEVATDRLVASPAFRAIYGLPPDVPLTTADIRAQVAPEDRHRVTSAAEREAGRGEGSTEYRIHRADTGEERWVARRGEIVRDAAGRPLRLRGVVQDVTDRRRFEERQRLLLREMVHRVKNNLAVVQAVAAQTMRGALTLEEAREAFNARLAALSRAHDVVARGQADGATLAELAADLLTVHGRGEGDVPIRAEGPPVRLGAPAALALALAFHELATNATKYGALSVPGGGVAITWRTEHAPDGPRLHLRWEEQGGPAVAPPARRGFGSRVIEDNLRRAWSAEVALHFAPAGLVLEAAAPLATLGREAGEGAA